MTVRAVPDGDERDKDVANAIRYAVDNGAKVLNMSFGKPVSPGKDKVWEAFKYAQDKGVLLVKAAGNENEDISEHVAFPTNFKDPADEKPFVNNVIVVGASTNDNSKLRASFSNYNQKMVDILLRARRYILQYRMVSINTFRVHLWLHQLLPELLLYY